VATLQRFRDQHAPSVRFLSDAKGQVMERYGVKAPVGGFAKRVTFVVDGKRRITAIQVGEDAVDAQNALQAAQACGG
jgi:peroxiredoxin